MKAPFVTLLFFLFVIAVPARAQPAASDGGLKSSFNDWVEDNIDPDVLKALQQLDQDRVRRLFSELGQAMSGTNIYQLATLRETAAQLAPLLQKYEETAPYGDWLQTQLDYMDAAARLEREMKRNFPKSALPPSPPMKLQRRVWVERMESRPWPLLAQTYVPRLKQIFISEKVPPELVWVAEVESSFNPSARSPAGAAGMFQLMPETARDQKLSRWPRDQRFQPDPSAHAAARELRELHHHYGDWRLALAAFNSGQARIDKLLKQYKTRSFDTIARRLPAETQMYVPKVEATIHKREGRSLTDLKIPGS